MNVVASEILGMVTCASLLAVLLALLERAVRIWRIPAEASRKAVHVGGGLACLALPFLLDTVTAVAALAVLFSAVLFAGERRGALRSLSGVRRESTGSFYFPVAVLLVYMIAGERTWLYVTSLLVLAVADSAAALIGKGYGRIHYTLGDGATKSLEGSLFFWLTAFLAVHLPLLLLTDVDRSVCVLAALLTATLLSFAEAVSIRGLDNIFVPVLTCYILLLITTKPPEEVLYQCVSLLALTALLVGVGRGLRLLTLQNCLFLVLFTYAVWALGTHRWAIPVLVVLATCAVAALRRQVRRPLPLTSDALLPALIPPLLILLAANSTELFSLFFPAFLIAVLAPGVIGLRQLRRMSRRA